MNQIEDAEIEPLIYLPQRHQRIAINKEKSFQQTIFFHKKLSDTDQKAKCWN